MCAYFCLIAVRSRKPAFRETTLSSFVNEEAIRGLEFSVFPFILLVFHLGFPKPLFLYYTFGIVL